MTEKAKPVSANKKLVFSDGSKVYLDYGPGGDAVGLLMHFQDVIIVVEGTAPALELIFNGFTESEITISHV